MTPNVDSATPKPETQCTRRSALTVGAAIAGTAGTALLTSPASAGAGSKLAPLPQVRPMSAQRVQQNWGVCDHPNFAGGYRNRAAVIDRLAGMRVDSIRGMYNANAKCAATTTRLRTNDMRWVMTVYPTEERLTTAALVARIQHIGDYAADVCRAIEGPNEWNNSRTGQVTLTPAQVVAIQRTIYQTVRADPRLNHVKVLGPAAHAIVLQNRDGQDYQDLVAAGITPYQDAQAVHAYCSASSITTNLARRLGYVYAAFGADYPVQLTETGWTTAGTTGSPQNSEADAATYSAQSILIMAGLGIPTMRYEVLDDSPMGGTDGFGLWACSSDATSGWRAKPEVAAVGNLLRALRDPGPTYTPAPVVMKIVGDVERAVTGRRDGTATAWLWVTGNTPVRANVTDSQGTRSFQVTRSLTRVPLRRAV